MGLDMKIVKYDNKDKETPKWLKQHKDVIEWRKEFDIHNWFIENTQCTVDCWQSAIFESILNKDDLLKLFDFIKNMEEDNKFTKFNKIEWLRLIKKEIELDEFDKYEYYYEGNW